MHLLERYSLSCGVKIDKPTIYQKFFPLPFDKYITFHPFSKPVKNYDYWQDVIDDINPYLGENGIRILQLGGKDEHEFNGCVHLQGLTSINQVAYLVDRSQLHLGVDSFPVHMAGSFDTPLVSLYSNAYIENCSPYWGDKDKQILLSPDFSVIKPSFSFEESPKRVNSIKSEEISKGALDLLQIKHNINYKTVFVGNRYSNMTMFSNVKPSSLDFIRPINGIEVRMDLNHNEKFLEATAMNSQVAAVIDKPINLSLLRKIKKNINVIFFMIKDNKHTDFINEVISLGIKINLISNLPQEEINVLKIHYYETGLISKLPEMNQEDKDKIFALDKNKLKFKSNKTFIHKDGMHMNRQKMDKGIPTELEGYQPVGDLDEGFFEDFGFHKIIKTA